jgi:hypothetical protein
MIGENGFKQLEKGCLTMKKLLPMLPVLFLLGGCAAALPALPALSGLVPPPAGTQVLTTTAVKLTRKNYRIIKANAMGASTGFNLLGLFTLRSPQYGEAISRLYRTARVAEGRAQAIVNVVHQNSSTYFILFALPKISVRADVIEFTDEVGDQPRETDVRVLPPVRGPR